MKKKWKRNALPWRGHMQTLRVMKVCVVLILLGAVNVFGTVKSQCLTLNVKDASLKEIFHLIEKESEFRFLYKSDDVSAIRVRQLQVTNENIEEILRLCFRDSQLAYEIDNKLIIVSRKDQAVPQQQVTLLTGCVTDRKGNVLPGVTVLLKGASIGVATDVNGNYKINILEGGKQQLVFSFVGMKTATIPYQGQKTLNVVLDESVNQMDEVVVTGYQEIKKERVTGSVEVVRAADIQNKGFTSLEEALKGNLPGVATMNISGRPGASAQIRIRGINSLTGDSEPIWIIDGMPMQGDLPRVGVAGTDFQNTVLTSGIGNIAPDDIESITILKDAAASAIYGARAANGVIVVKTKRGIAGESYINVQSAFTLEEAPTNRLQMMNSPEKVAFERSLYADFSQLQVDGRVFSLLKDADRGYLTKADADKEIDRLSKINTDWFKEIFRMSKNHNHNVSLSGGDERTRYYGSLNFISQTGIVPNNKYTKFGGSLKLTHDFNKWVRVYCDLNSTMRNDQTTASIENPLRYATFANTYERPYDENGNYDYDRSYSYDRSLHNGMYKYNFNMLEDLNRNTSKTKYVSNGINLKLELQLFEGMMFSSQGTVAATTSHTKSEVDPGSYSSKKASWVQILFDNYEIPAMYNNGSLTESTSRAFGWTIRDQFEYSRLFADKHYVNGVVGHEVSDNQTDNFMNYSPEYTPEYGIVGFPDLEGYKMEKLNFGSLGSTNYFQNRSVSFFATASYSYLDRYVVSGSYRLDGVDIIGSNNRFSPLWNISARWNLHENEFMKSVGWINRLSLRGSYGYTGSIDHNAYPFTVMSFDYAVRWGEERIPTTIAPSNPSIKWQKKQDRSTGFESVLFNNRVNFTVNYYNNVTRDLLDNKTIPVSTGRDRVKANVASLRNSGWEFSINTVNVEYRDFRWTTAFNIAYNKNTVLETYLKSVRDIPEVSRQYDASQSYFVEGQPVNVWYGYKFAGVDPASGHSLAYIDEKDEQGKPIGHLQPDGRYVIDMDSEGMTAGKYAIQSLGEGYPPVTGGFGTTLTWRGISVSSQFSFMTGHKIKSFQSYNQGPITAARLNQIKPELNRWRKPGDITNIPGYVANGFEHAYSVYFFDSEIENGSFVKCNYISMGYNMPTKLCSKLRMSRFRINFNMHNLFTWTKYRGIDPENMGAFGYPSSKKYIFSLNFGI